MTTKVTAKNAYDIYVEAFEAGKAAAEAAIPTPMYVGTAKSLFDDSIDTSQPIYYVSEGVCGRASVTIRPARGALVTMLKARGIGYKGYYGGWTIPAWELGSPRGSQSMERAEAAARAAAAVFASYDVKAYADSSLD